MCILDVACPLRSRGSWREHFELSNAGGSCTVALGEMNIPNVSNGYEAIALEYISARSRIGVEVVRKWARSIPKESAVLDLGCGNGVPITQTLIEERLHVYGVDASPRMIAAFQFQFPNVAVECITVEKSDFFHRSFDAVIAWGLMFLLTPESQRVLVRKVSRALVTGGRFLFTAPKSACEWLDMLTGLKSVSLGEAEYCRILNAEGLIVTSQEEDDGGNHYYFAEKREVGEHDR